MSIDLEDLFKIYNNRNEMSNDEFEDEAKTANLNTLQAAIDSYYNEMKAILDDSQTFSNDSFELSHLKIKAEKITEVGGRILK